MGRALKTDQFLATVMSAAGKHNVTFVLIGPEEDDVIVSDDTPCTVALFYLLCCSTLLLPANVQMCYRINHTSRPVLI